MELIVFGLYYALRTACMQWFAMYLHVSVDSMQHEKYIVYMECTLIMNNLHLYYKIPILKPSHAERVFCAGSAKGYMGTLYMPCERVTNH